MFENVISRSAIIVVVIILLLLFTPLDWCPCTFNQSAIAQTANTTLSSVSLRPPPLEQLSTQQIAASTNNTCTLTPSLIEIEGTPQQTEGPYFVDGMPNRSDLRSESSDGSMQEGIPLRLIINIYDVDDDDNSCVPFEGAKVDIWEANSQGMYSGIAEDGTKGKNFLRGYQMADDNGTVRFTTVFPGWYEDRAIHIHIKVRDYDGTNKP
jgi:protocatechuate 3,4-dioxygenase beta subunit